MGVVSRPGRPPGRVCFSINTGMITIPFKALKKFINERISISAATSRDQLVKPVEVDALVMLSDPYALGDGIGPDGSKPKYSVMVEAKAVAGITIIPGASIAANGSRPKLMVNSVHPNSESLWLDCTATEGAV